MPNVQCIPGDWYPVISGPLLHGASNLCRSLPEVAIAKKDDQLFDNCLLRRPKPHPLTSPARILPIKLNKQSSFELLRGPNASLLGLERVITHLPEPRQLLIKQPVSQFKVGASEGN